MIGGRYTVIIFMEKSLLKTEHAASEVGSRHFEWVRDFLTFPLVRKGLDMLGLARLSQDQVFQKTRGAGSLVPNTVIFFLE